MATVFRQAPNGFMDATAGMKLRREIYEPGDSRDVGESIEKFLGRKSSIEPFSKTISACNLPTRTNGQLMRRSLRLSDSVMRKNAFYCLAHFCAGSWLALFLPELRTHRQRRARRHRATTSRSCTGATARTRATSTRRPEEAETSSHVFNALFEGLVSQDPQRFAPHPRRRRKLGAFRPTPGFIPSTCVHDARWSNGDPVTAHDFIESWHRLLKPGARLAVFADALSRTRRSSTPTTSTTASSPISTRWVSQAPDDHTLVVHLVNPADYFLSMLNHESLYPVHLPTILKYGRFRPERNRLDAARVLSSATVRSVLKSRGTCGRTSSWSAARRIGTPKNVRLKEIHYYPTDNIDTEERDFRAGQLHVTYEMPLTKIDLLREELSGRCTRIRAYLGTYFLRLNLTTRPPLTDRRVRRALAMAIDREGIAKTVARGGQRPAYQLRPARYQRLHQPRRCSHRFRRRAPPARRGRVTPMARGPAEHRNPHQHQRE